jgi:DNA modification methylase
LIEALNFAEGDKWAIYNGDCIEVMKQLPSESIGYSVFSPPFASMYTYSNADRDLGNCNSHEEFHEHFGFVLGELYRLLKPGRLLSMHCMDMPTSKTRDGVIGARDFPGELIAAAQSKGFIFHSRVCIWKDPVTAMQRTKAIGLLYKQLRKDSCMSRQGFADYVVTLRKRGDNPEPVTHTHESLPVDVWQKYASPVWMDINQSRTLQYRAGRDVQDERHICPLQLDVIERCVELWSNPKDVVLSPFSGIGSEVFTAAEMGRYGLGIELKPSYWEQSVRNMEHVGKQNGGLFDEVCDTD